jgi:hypothetical protein
MEQLSRQVGDVAEVHHLRLRRDGALHPLIQVVLRRRHGEIDAGDLDAFAARPLIPGREHAAVVLLGGQHLVAGLEVDAVLRDLEGFARIPRERELLLVAAELGREPPARRLLVLFELAAMVHRRLVAEIEVALQRVVNDGGAGTAVAVVQIDQRAIEREGGLDVAPVELVLRDVLGRSAGDLRGRREDFFDAECRERAGGTAGRTGHAKKGSSADHGNLRENSSRV